jgi:hypothetical protein
LFAKLSRSRTELLQSVSGSMEDILLFDKSKCRRQASGLKVFGLISVNLLFAKLSHSRTELLRSVFG